MAENIECNFSPSSSDNVALTVNFFVIENLDCHTLIKASYIVYAIGKVLKINKHLRPLVFELIAIFSPKADYCFKNT